MGLINFACDFIRVFLWKHAWPFLRLESKLDTIPSFNILVFQFPYMVDVHRTYNDVLAISHWSHNHIMIPIVFEFDVLGSKRFEL